MSYTLPFSKVKVTSYKVVVLFVLHRLVQDLQVLYKILK